MVDLILVAVVAITAYIGFKKGFIKAVVSFASTLISLFLTSIIYRPVSILLYNIGLGKIAKNISLEILEEKASEGISAAVIDKSAIAMSVIIVNIISFIAVIIGIKILLGIFSKSLNLVAKLPIIKQANSLLGFLVGVVSGLLICYIIIGVIAALDGNETINIIRGHIESSFFAITLYEDNIIADLLSSVLSK